VGRDALLTLLVCLRKLCKAAVDDELVGREAVVDLIADLLHEPLEHKL
jgi:hypothetical protein